MNITLMRNIDRFVGVPLCWMLGIGRLFTRKKKFSHVNNILVIKFFGMGSIILSSPALSLLRSEYPTAGIDVLTFDSNRELVERYPMVNRVLAIRSTSLPQFLQDAFSIIGHLRKTQYDVVFDFEFFSKLSTLLSSMTRAPYRVGFALPTKWRSMLLTHQVLLKKDNHVSKSFCELVFTLVGTREIPPVSSPAVRRDDVESMQNKLPLNGKPIVAINVNVSDTFLERRWMPERFAELVTKLSFDHDWVFFFIGLENEHDYVQSVIDMTKCEQRCYNIAGMLTIPELSAFLQRCDMLVSSDSGPVHLAAALNIRVIGLYGPESPYFYGPVNNTATTVYKAVACSPCMNVYTAKSYRCPYNARCMHDIHTDEVVHVIEEVLVKT